MHKENFKALISPAIWANFVEPAAHISDSEVGNWIDRELLKYNAKDVLYGNYVEFKTEEDCIFFKLKFS